jgi:hypothetical protein
MKILILLSIACAALAIEYRTYTGANNNQANPTWGATGSHFRREDGKTYYDDGISVPRGGFPNSTLPNERVIKNTMIIGGQPFEEGISSDWAWVVGEYLAFETVKTSSPQPGNPEPWNVTLPSDDPYFAAHGGQVLFNRAAYDSATGTTVSNSRQQVSGAPAFIDASTIYGENDLLAAWNRNGTGGLLVWVPGPDGEFPPKVGPGPYPVPVDNPAGNVPTSELFIMGSPRINQQPQSMCLGILWRREHNRQARLLATKNPTWDDEMLFQEARRRVIALMQHFYETEYIPMLLGNPNLDPYTGYDPTLDPSVDFFFNTVSLRYGHTQVNNITWRLEEDGSFSTGGNLLLRNIFFDPTSLYLEGGCSTIYRGLAAKKHNSPEVNIVDDLQNYLFAKAGNVGRDLLSTNLRRARDVGLPPYNVARTIYGYPPQISFNYSEWQPNFIKAYGSDDPTNCDPWICCLLESGINGGELGEVNHEVVKRQFHRFRAGDRFWYANNQFDSATLAEIQATKLSHIILRNSQVKKIKCNVFEVPGDPYTGVPGPYCTLSTTTGSLTTGSDASTMFASALLVLLAVVLAL